MNRDDGNDDGYTLLEVVVVMGIMSIVLAAVLGALIPVYSTVNRAEGFAFARDQVAASFRRLDTELRYANWLADPGQVGDRYYLEFAKPTEAGASPAASADPTAVDCRQLIFAGGVLSLASWTASATAPGTPGRPVVIASELALVPGTKGPFEVYAPGDHPYASADPGTAGVGTQYSPEFGQVRLRVNAVAGATTVPFDTLFTAQNMTRITAKENLCSSGRPTT